jgi:putative MATE family efflux protein
MGVVEARRLEHLQSYGEMYNVLTRSRGKKKKAQMQKAISLIKRALKGEHHDYTSGQISEAVILLAIPMILEIGLESVFAVVDMFFVSGLGQNAIATVGLTESVVTLVYSIAIGVSTAATAIVARRIGEKNPDAAARAGAQSILLSFVLSIVLGALGFIFAGDILRLMGAEEGVIREGTPFARIMLTGCAPILLLFLINGIFRGAGNAAMAMKSLWIASGVNILLCPLLIHFYGLTGAAVATIIGRSTGVIYQCYHLFKGGGELRLKRTDFNLDFSLLKSLVNVAWPASIQFLIGSGSWIVLTRLIAETGGTAASAGYQIAFRCFVFFILPAWGLSNAAATLVGQNLGAKQVNRAEESVWVTAKISAVFMALVTLFLVAFAKPIIGLFTQDEAVFQYGVEGLRIISSGFIFYGISMVLTQALNGAGDTKTPTRLNLFCFWIFQTPLAYLLIKYTSLKTAGVMISIPFAHALIVLAAWYVFKKGKWRDVQL